MTGTVRCELAFACDVRWEDMAPTADAAVRTCRRCAKPVYAVDDEAQFVARAMAGDCVAFRPADLPGCLTPPLHEPPPPEHRLAGVPVRPVFSERFDHLLGEKSPEPAPSWWRRLLGLR